MFINSTFADPGVACLGSICLDPFLFAQFLVSVLLSQLVTLPANFVMYVDTCLTRLRSLLVDAYKSGVVDVQYHFCAYFMHVHICFTNFHVLT